MPDVTCEMSDVQVVRCAKCEMPVVNAFARREIESVGPEKYRIRPQKTASGPKKAESSARKAQYKLYNRQREFTNKQS